MEMPALQDIVQRILSDKTFTAEERHEKAVALILNQRQNVIEFRYHSLSAEGFLSVVQVIPHCQFLTTICLFNNDADSQGFLALAEVIPHCPSLTIIDLSHNNIGDEECVPLARAIPLDKYQFQW